MPQIRRSLTPLLAVAALVAGGSAVAAASPEAVLADYQDNGVVDGTYPVQDLSRALQLARARESAQYEDAASAIQDARAAALTGGRSGGGPSGGVPAKDDPAAGTPAGDGISSLERDTAQPFPLPSPPTVEPGAGVPWPFLVLSVLAGLLGLGGAASATYRRLSR